MRSARWPINEMLGIKADWGAMVNEIGNRIRRLRRAQSLSQQDISTNGVSVPYISRIETGDIAYPSHTALIAIGERLGVSALELETGDPEAHCTYCRRGDNVGV